MCQKQCHSLAPVLHLVTGTQSFSPVVNLCLAAVGISSSDWQTGSFKIMLMIRQIHTLPVSFCTYCYSLGTSLPTGKEERERERKSCIHVKQSCSLSRGMWDEQSGGHKKETAGKLERRQSDRQTVCECLHNVEWCACLVLIQVNPTGSYTYGSRAQPFSYSVVEGRLKDET